MSARSFRSVFMVASCAGAALGCYLVSLRVASERAALEEVETRIVMAQRDIRLLQTEIGTRGRLAQLERWNVKVLALSAPSADQFLEGGFALAKLARPQEMIDPAAPVVLATAPAPDRPTPLAEPEQAEDSAPPAGPAALMRQASLKTDIDRDSPKQAIALPKSKAATGAARPTEAKASVAAPKTPAAKDTDKASTEKTRSAAAKAVTKSTRLAKADPLAALPIERKSKAAKDSGPTR